MGLLTMVLTSRCSERVLFRLSQRWRLKKKKRKTAAFDKNEKRNGELTKFSAEFICRSTVLVNYNPFLVFHRLAQFFWLFFFISTIGGTQQLRTHLLSKFNICVYNIPLLA